jgi:hypothetical protein
MVNTQMAYDIAYAAVVPTVGRRDRLEEVIAVMAADSPYTPVATRLGCLRGVSTLTAFGLAVEAGSGNGCLGARSARSSGWCPPSTPAVRPAPAKRSPRPATGAV